MHIFANPITLEIQPEISLENLEILLNILEIWNLFLSFGPLGRMILLAKVLIAYMVWRNYLIEIEQLCYELASYLLVMRHYGVQLCNINDF